LKKLKEIQVLEKCVNESFFLNFKTFLLKGKNAKNIPLQEMVVELS
jgi:hypothetical protein